MPSGHITEEEKAFGKSLLRGKHIVRAMEILEAYDDFTHGDVIYFSGVLTYYGHETRTAWVAEHIGRNANYYRHMYRRCINALPDTAETADREELHALEDGVLADIFCKGDVTTFRLMELHEGGEE